METCKNVHRFICEQLDQDVDSPRCRAIKKHLATCTDCSTYLATLKKTVTLYKLLPPPILPRAAHNQLFHRLSKELEARVPLTHPAKSFAQRRKEKQSAKSIVRSRKSGSRP